MFPEIDIFHLLTFRCCCCCSFSYIGRPRWLDWYIAQVGPEVLILLPQFSTLTTGMAGMADLLSYHFHGLFTKVLIDDSARTIGKMNRLCKTESPHSQTDAASLPDHELLLPSLFSLTSLHPIPEWFGGNSVWVVLDAPWVWGMKANAERCSGMEHFCATSGRQTGLSQRPVAALPSPFLREAVKVAILHSGLGFFWKGFLLLLLLSGKHWSQVSCFLNPEHKQTERSKPHRRKGWTASFSLFHTSWLLSLIHSFSLQTHWPSQLCSAKLTTTPFWNQWPLSSLSHRNATSCSCVEQCASAVGSELKPRSITACPCRNEILCSSQRVQRRGRMLRALRPQGGEVLGSSLT